MDPWIKLELRLNNRFSVPIDAIVPDGGGPEVEVRVPGPVVRLLTVVPGGGGRPEVEACRVPGPVSRLVPDLGPGGGTGLPCAWILADLRILAAAVAIASLLSDNSSNGHVRVGEGRLDGLVLVHVCLYLFTCTLYLFTCTLYLFT